MPNVLRDSIPFAAGEVTAVSAGEVELTEHVEHEIAQFHSDGTDNDKIVGSFFEEFRANPEATVLQLSVDERNNLIRKKLDLAGALAVITSGTEQDPKVISLVESALRTLNLPSEIVPRDIKLGDKLGVWASKDIQVTPYDPDQSQSVIGKIAITAVLKLP